MASTSVWRTTSRCSPGCSSRCCGAAFPAAAKHLMKPSLVTGASGFLGWHVARVLLERGHRVRALVGAGSRVEGLDVETVTGDLREAASLDPAAAGWRLG